MSDAGYLMDEEKLAQVLAKHGVEFIEILEACEDPHCMMAPDPQDHPERYLIVGQTRVGRLLEVICSDEELPIVRLVTAFDADPKWRRDYER